MGTRVLGAYNIDLYYEGYDQDLFPKMQKGSCAAPAGF